MKAIQAHPQQGPDGRTLVDLPNPGDPEPAAMLMVRQQRPRGLIVDSRRRHPLAELASAFRLQNSGGRVGKIVAEFQHAPTVRQK